MNLEPYLGIGPLPPPGGTGPACPICGASNRIEIGGAGDANANHPNIDVREMPGVDMVFDLETGRIPFHDGHAEQVRMIHVINHLTAVTGEKILAESLRVLKPGGQLYIMVTDMEWTMKKILEEGLIDELATCVWGTRGDSYPSDFHKWGYTRQSLEKLLLKTGFSRVEQLGWSCAWEFKLAAYK